MNTIQSKTKNEIIACEEKLLNAFANKDLKTIDEMIHEDALFVYPNGLPVTKGIVIENYRVGNSAFTTVIATDQLISLVEDTAVVSMNLELKGKYHDQEISSNFRYIRVWKQINEQWKAIAVSGVPVVK
jgi:ketosteroid isomerase-like protein